MNRIAMLDRKGMATLVAALLGASAAAQSTSLPPICFSFNQNGPAGAPSAPVYPISFPGAFTVWFSPPMTTTVEALDLPMAFSWGGPAASADIYVAPAFGVPPVTPSLGTFLPTGVLGGWIPFVTTTSVPVAGGGAYALVLRAIPPPGSTTWCSALQYDPLPAQPLPYQFTGTSCPTTLLPSGMIAGSPIVPGSSCLHYLDPLSLTTLFASGLEPLAQVAPPTNQNVALGHWYP